MADVKKFVIEREKWFRGQGDACSALLNEYGAMCCLGFFGIALGYEPDSILDFADPEDVARQRVNLWPDLALEEKPERDLDEQLIGYRTRNSLDINDLIVANDAFDISEPEREERIAKLFAKHGVEVEFK